MSRMVLRRRGLLAAPALAIPVTAPDAAAQERQQTGRQPGQPSGTGRAARANAGTVGVISGGVDGTYIRIAADLAAVLDEGESLRVLPMIGKGSVQNIADLLFLRAVDVGIVQSDTLAFLRARRLFGGAEGMIRSVAKLYDEEVHVLARAGVSALGELAGRRVNVDVPGSGTAMTAALLFENLGIAVQPVHEAQDAALLRLRAGEIDALVYVAGKPARLFTSVEADSGLRLLPVPPDPRLLRDYLPAEFGRDDYPRLLGESGAVDTVAVGAVLSAYGWRPGTERHGKVARLAAALEAKFPLLLRPPRHPKWREVNLAAQAPGWSRFDPAPAQGGVPGGAPGRGRRQP